MKKLYLLLTLLVFALSNTIAQTTVTFESSTIGAASFTSDSKTFNLSSNLSTFTVESLPGLGYNASNRYIQVGDQVGGPPGTYGQTGTITTTGSFRLISLWIYLTGDPATQYPNVTYSGANGSVTFVGKLGGATQFSVTKTYPNSNIGFALPGNGFNFVDFAAQSSLNIDTLEIQLSSNYDYFAIDNFIWTVNSTPTINNPGTLGSFTSCSGTPSATQSFNVSGNALSSDIVVNAPTGFEVSLLSTSGFSSSVTVTQSGGNASSTVYVRTTSGASGNPTGSITLSSTGASNVNISTTATIIPLPNVTAHPPARSICAGANTTFTVTASNTTGYQWQVNTGSGFSDITNTGVYSGATTSVLTITGATIGMNGYQYRAKVINGSCTDNSNSAGLTIPTISGTTVVTNVACNGGTTGAINLTPTGGTGPYTFNWGGGVTSEDRTGLAAGSYSVTITDTASGCTGTVNAIVTQPTALTLTQNSQTNIACYGGSTGAASVNAASGGAGGYTYNWTPGNPIGDGTTSVTGLTAGTWTCTVTDLSGCTKTQSFTVTQPATAVSGTVVVTNVSCNGGSNGAINLTPTGGTGPYTFNWVAGPTTEDRTGLAAGTYSVTITDANGCTGTVSGITVTQPTAIILTANSQTNIACNGGSTGAASVNAASGGAGGYTYNWTPGNPTGDGTTSVTGLTAGTWTCTVTDLSGCTKTQSFTVTQPVAVVSGTTVVTNVACNGGNTGAINLTPSGGTGPYTFNWANGPTTEDRTGLAAGTYSVTITDANGCTGTVNATVTQPATAISGTTAVTNVSCNGGSNGTINLTPTGGTGSYTFSWADGPTTEDRTGLAAGTYSVIITDANACTAIISGITITQPATAISGTVVVTNVSCNGGSNGSINLTPTGGTAPYTFNWVAGPTTEDRTGLVAGTYSVTITDANGCTGTVSGITVTQPPVLNATAAAQTNVACNGAATGSATVNVTGGTGTYTYSWAPSGGNAATASNLAAGTYTVTVTDANSCTDTQSFTITQPTVLATSAGTVINVSCNGGSNGAAQVIASGGTPGYTYLWNTTPAQTTSTATGLAAGTYTVTVTDGNGCETTRNFTINQPPALVASFGSQTNVSCNGGANGTAQVIASGGTPGYTYSWAPTGGTAQTASGLVAGTYTVTVTDANNCQTTQSFTITQPSALTATTSKTDVLCNGSATGTATVVANGGTPSYTYLWSPSGGTAATATGLVAGNYSCLITDNNGCSTTKNFTITQPAALSATTSQINATCSTGGDASVTPFGGTPGYTYLWSPSGATTSSVNGLTAGSHSCVITDANGCTVTKNFTITTTNTLVATTSQTNVLCNGTNTGAATVTPSGAPGPYTYIWSPSGGNADTATNLAAGTYSVLITASNGCSITKNFTITEPTALAASAGAQTNVNCNGGVNGSATVAVTGGIGPYTYLWAPSGGTAATATGLAAGTYTVTIKDANLCQTTQSFTITQPSALVATAGTQTNVSCNGGTNGSATVAVTGGTGAYTYVWAPSGGTAATASGLAAGTYTVTVKDANLCQTTQSFTITQPTAMIATASAQTNIACNGGSTGSATVTVTGGTGAYTYQWAPTGGTAATASGLAAGTYTVTVKDANLCQTTQSFTLTEPTVLVATPVSLTNIACNGNSTGSATVTATGGMPPYTYSWAPSGGTAATASGLAAGTYTATVTDANGCTSSQSFTITQPTALAATTSQTNVSCFGASNGTATVVVTGGTPAYTYSWAPSGGTAATATGLADGTYTVTITDANSCTLTKTFTITSSQALTVVPSQTNVTCNGATNGTATVAVTGGTGTYTYVWSPSGGTSATATGLAPGTYSVAITDGNGCTTSQNFTITQPAPLVLNGTSSNISCNGTSNGMATVTPTGGTSPYTYSWASLGATTPTVTGLSGGNYSVTVTDANGCTQIRSFTIYEQPAIVVTSVKTDVLCSGAMTGSATVSATGGVPNYTYAWSNGFGGPTVNGLGAGTYTCTVTDALGCSVVHSITINSPEAIDVDVTQTNVSCTSNTDGAISLNVTGGVGSYTYQWTPATAGTGATVTGLSAGNYSVIITDANGCSALRNFSITQPVSITATIVTTDATCYGANDGTVNITAVNGGTPPYIFGMNAESGGAPDPSYLTAGNYSIVILDANGCTYTQNITITQPAQTIVTTHPQNVSAQVGATITYTTATQNANGYQWQYTTNGTDWNNVADGGTNPTYSGATTATLTVADVPNNFNGYSYRVALTAGTNCITYTNIATLSVNNALQAVNDNFSTNEILKSEGGIAGDVTANDLFNSQAVNDSDIIISIVDNDGLVGVSVDDDGNLNVPANTNVGTYTITYSICDNTALNNCSTAEAVVVVTDISGISDLTKLELNLYPNPATTNVFIKIPGFENHRNMKLSIYDLNGRLIKQNFINTELQSVDVTGIESGVYLFRITSDTSETTRRVVVDKKF